MQHPKSEVWPYKKVLPEHVSELIERCKAVLDSLYLGAPKHLRLERKYNLYVGRYYDGIDPNRTS